MNRKWEGLQLPGRPVPHFRFHGLGIRRALARGHTELRGHAGHGGQRQVDIIEPLPGVGDLLNSPLGTVPGLGETNEAARVADV